MGNEDCEPLPRHFGDYPGGAYWSVDPVGLPGDESDERTVSGSVIRFMWDYGVGVPLWDADGLVPGEPEWLRAQLGLSDWLIVELIRWGGDMEALDGAHGVPESRYEALDLRARTLVDRLQQELGSQFTVKYRPW